MDFSCYFLSVGGEAGVMKEVRQVAFAKIGV